ncbi:MAG: hypothetical protein H7123_06005 [Thermoleophilia bacterium]|nr:hypothetical protein [Thermoleophilia bacterium]
MNTAAATRQPANNTAMWALIAVLACLVTAALGWGIASANTTSWSDVQRDTAFAAQNGQLAGEQRGYGQGVTIGKRDARLKGQSAATAAVQSQQAQGYSDGFQNGRQTAINKRGAAAFDDPMSLIDPTPLMPGLGTGGAYPAESFQDLLAGTELDTDASGFAPTLSNSNPAFGTDGLNTVPASSSSDWYRGGSSSLYGG